MGDQSAILSSFVELPLLPRLDARIPKWSLHRLEFRQCPLCQSSNQPRLLRPDQLPIAFCEPCQLWYVSGLPPVDEIQKLYQGYWFTVRPKDLSQRYADCLLGDDDRNMDEDDIRLIRLGSLLHGLQGKQLLDIGCGCGEFLIAARRQGATVIGNDVSAEACSFVRDRLQIPVIEGPLSTESFTKQFGQMDVVVMSDLIEHPVDPLRMFESALSVLKRGGLLLLLTPNGGEACTPPMPDLASAVDWVGFRRDLEHLQYFSSGTIATLANRYNVRIEHLESLGYPWLGPLPPRPAGRLKARLIGAAKKLIFTRKLLRARRMVQVSDPRCGTYILIAILRKIDS